MHNNPARDSSAEVPPGPPDCLPHPAFHQEPKPSAPSPLTPTPKRCPFLRQKHQSSSGQPYPARPPHRGCGSRSGSTSPPGHTKCRPGSSPGRACLQPDSASGSSRGSLRKREGRGAVRERRQRRQAEAPLLGCSSVRPAAGTGPPLSPSESWLGRPVGCWLWGEGGRTWTLFLWPERQPCPEL